MPTAVTHELMPRACLASSFCQPVRSGTAPVKDGTPTTSAEATAFDHPATVFHGSRDARVTEAMTLEWARFHRGAAGGEKDRQCVFESVEIEGGHLFNREKDAKRAWLERVVEDIERELAP